jgi:CDP-diacylglycerol--glycerol-3-phosphate 3-phosphatidyltransferase
VYEEAEMRTTMRPATPVLRPRPERDALCTHRGCIRESAERIATIANTITMTRSVAAHGCVLAAIATGSTSVLLAGLATHLVGDIADGAVARLRGEETVSGAMLDIICDRLFYGTYYTVFAMLHPSMLVAAGIFMFTFMVLDAHLSMSFLYWPLRSVNYFDLIDLAIYWWNFSKFGKALLGAPLLVATLLIGSPALSTATATAIAALKLLSLWRLHSARVPLRPGCAAAVKR